MTQEIKFVYLKGHPLFASLSEQKLQEACQLLKVKTVYRGDLISYGDTGYSKLHLLIKGKIKTTESSDSDEELVKDLLTAPDVFGDLGLQGNFSSAECAEALAANTIVCSFYTTDFRKILQDNISVAINYATTVNNKLRKLEGRHADLVFHDAKSRLIRFIKNWARTDGNRIGDKIILHNYLTHSDIAGVISTSRQSVNVLFNELRDSGMLFYDRKSIQLNDPVAWN
jgi:CRP/FNR family transcriptional regulator, cyclic AMP receptor protein